MLATFAFDVCHEVYRGAREMLDEKIPTLSLENSAKYQWHPDRTPGLAEYVADFARAGERALGEPREGLLRRARRDGRPGGVRACPPGGRRACQQDGRRACQQTGRQACPPGERRACQQTGRRASRLILFRVFYLGGAEFHAARRHLGISELTWADWTEEIRTRVGQELLRSGIFPPSQYFQVMTRPAEADRGARRQMFG